MNYRVTFETVDKTYEYVIEARSKLVAREDAYLLARADGMSAYRPNKTKVVIAR